MLLHVSRPQDRSPAILEASSNLCVNVLSDNLTANYTGHVSQSQSACVRGATPLCPNIPGSGIAYFEVLIKQKGLKSAFYIGVSDKTFQLSKVLGSTKKSFAMRWDGKPFHGNSFAGNGFPDISLTEGGVVGCGVNFDKREIFYTYNGKHLGVLFAAVDIRDYFATVGLGSFGEQVTFSFLGPFVFDLAGMVCMENNGMLREITQEEVSPDRLHDLIHDFLFHEGYADTLVEFDRSAGYQCTDPDTVRLPTDLRKRTSSLGRLSEMMEPILLSETSVCSICSEPTTSKVCEKCLKMIVARVEPSSPVKLSVKSPSNSRKSSEQPFALRMERCDSTELSTFYLKESVFEVAPGNADAEMKEDAVQQSYEKVRVRGDLRRLICSGEVEETIRRLNELFPGMLEKNPPALLALHIQQFIELIGRQQACEALLYARKHLTEYRREQVRVRKHTDETVDITEVLGLLCYVYPERSPICHLLHQNQRELTADIVNSTILETEGKGHEGSRLESALQELVAGAQVYQKLIRKGREDVVDIQI